jgi:guanine nucleotide-binding protein G(i) subunit alpha
MGNCAGGSTSDDPEASAKSKQIDRDLRKYRKDELDRIQKLLFLGAGEAGKSTVLKQLRCIFGVGIGEEEKDAYLPVVYYNVFSTCRSLLEGCERWGYELPKELLDDSEKIKNADLKMLELTPAMADTIAALWKTEGIQEAYNRRSELQLADSAKYCFENVKRFAEASYSPTTDDCLHMRSRTTGLVEFKFETDGSIINVIDVGGQRSERRKWLHCFQNVTAIVFFVALSEYDMGLREDPNVKRMHESLALFRDLINGPWFKDTAVILFLNKKDLFKLKIQETDLSWCFPEYKGGKKYGPAVKCMLPERRAKSEERRTKSEERRAKNEERRTKRMENLV